MPQLTRQTAETMLDLAAEEPIGLLIQVSDLVQARSMLYSVRAKRAKPQWNQLQLRASPIEGGNLVICRGGARAGAEPPTANSQRLLPSDEATRQALREIEGLL